MRLLLFFWALLLLLIRLSLSWGFLLIQEIMLVYFFLSPHSSFPVGFLFHLWIFSSFGSFGEKNSRKMGQEKRSKEKKNPQKKKGRRHSLAYFLSRFCFFWDFQVWCMYDRSHLLHTNGVFCWLRLKFIHEFRTLNCVRTD